MILPGVTLGSAYAAYIARLTRGGMLEVASDDLYQRDDGIEFRGDGTWRLLHESAEATFQSQQGIEASGTWGEKYTGFIGYFQVNWRDAPNGLGLRVSASSTRARPTGPSVPTSTPATSSSSSAT